MKRIFHTYVIFAQLCKLMIVVPPWSSYYTESNRERERQRSNERERERERERESKEYALYEKEGERPSNAFRMHVRAPHHTHLAVVARSVAKVRMIRSVSASFLARH